MKVICISGKAQHGKDTTALFMQNELENSGRKVIIAHYGDLVKYICKTFFNWNGLKDVCGRSLLQKVGTDIVRKQMPDYWVDFIIDMAKFFGEEWDYMIIPDCRFKNECLRWKQANFQSEVIRVNRPNFDSGLTKEQLEHKSETDMDDYDADYYITNSEGIDELYIKAVKIARMIDGGLNENSLH